MILTVSQGHRKWGDSINHNMTTY